MKKLLLSISVLMISLGHAQIVSDTVYASFFSSVDLTFPDTIKVDLLGNEHLLIGTKDVNRYNIAYKSAKPQMHENSSLKVELVSGHIYSFKIIYMKDVPLNSYGYDFSDASDTNNLVFNARNQAKSIPQEVKESPTKKKTKRDKDLTDVERFCKKTARHSNTHEGIGLRDSHAEFYLNTLLVGEDKMYFKVTVEDHTSYGINFSGFRFAIVSNEHKTKSSTVDDEELNILAVYEVGEENFIDVMELTDNEESVTYSRLGYRGKCEKVFVLDKYTLSQKKFLEVAFWDESGERDLKFKIKSKELLKAKRLY